MSEISKGAGRPAKSGLWSGCTIILNLSLLIFSPPLLLLLLLLLPLQSLHTPPSLPPHLHFYLPSLFPPCFTPPLFVQNNMPFSQATIPGREPEFFSLFPARDEKQRGWGRGRIDDETSAFGGGGGGGWGFVRSRG